MCRVLVPDLDRRYSATINLLYVYAVEIHGDHVNARLRSASHGIRMRTALLLVLDHNSKGRCTAGPATIEA